MSGEPVIQLTAMQEEKPFSEMVRMHMQAYFKSHLGGLPCAGVYDRLMPLIEKPLIEITLEATVGNQIKAAEILGINRNTLRKKMKDLGIKNVAKSKEAASPL